MNQKHTPDVIECCQRLVRQQSYSGQEQEVVAEIRRLMEQLGYQDIFIDDAGNIVGGMKGLLAGKTILFDGHIDTVPADPSQWQTDPFGAEILDGKLYGRGTSDMKGAVAAMLSAVSAYAHDKKFQFAGQLYVSCTVHEECFEGVASRLISQCLTPDLVVIGESTELNLAIGQRGRAEIMLETFGRPAHSANPEKGINAVNSMVRLLQRLHALQPNQHPLLGKGILEITDIKSSPWPGASVVPDYCRATADRRLLVGETTDSVLAPLQHVIDSLMAEDPLFSAKVSFAEGHESCYTGLEFSETRFFPGWVMSPDDPLIGQALRGLTNVGLTPQVQCYSFCTNGSHYAGEAGIPTLGFGPSRESLAHVIDEYIEVEQLVAAARGYYGLAAAFTEPTR